MCSLQSKRKLSKAIKIVNSEKRKNNFLNCSEIGKNAQVFRFFKIGRLSNTLPQPENSHYSSIRISSRKNAIANEWNKTPIKGLVVLSSDDSKEVNDKQDSRLNKNNKYSNLSHFSDHHSLNKKMKNQETNPGSVIVLDSDSSCDDGKLDNLLISSKKDMFNGIHSSSNNCNLDTSKSKRKKMLKMRVGELDKVDDEKTCNHMLISKDFLSGYCSSNSRKTKEHKKKSDKTGKLILSRDNDETDIKQNILVNKKDEINPLSINCDSNSDNVSQAKVNRKHKLKDKHKKLAGLSPDSESECVEMSYIKTNDNSISNTCGKIKKKKKKEKADEPLYDDGKTKDIKCSKENNEIFSATNSSKMVKNKHENAKSKQGKLIISSNVNESCQNNTQKINEKCIEQSILHHTKRKIENIKTKRNDLITLYSSDDENYVQKTKSRTLLSLNNFKGNASKIINEERHKMEETKGNVIVCDVKNCEVDVQNCFNYCDKDSIPNKKYNCNTEKTVNETLNYVVLSDDSISDDAIFWEKECGLSDTNIAVENKSSELEQYITLSDNSESDDEISTIMESRFIKAVTNKKNPIPKKHGSFTINETSLCKENSNLKHNNSDKPFCDLELHSDENIKFSDMTKNLLSQLEEEKVDYNIPLLHKNENLNTLTKEEKHVLMSNGLIIRKGNFSKREDFIILQNLQTIITKFSIDDPGIFLGIGNHSQKKLVHEFIKAKHIYVRLGHGLNDRSLKSIYDRARILLLKPQIVGKKFSSEEISQIRKLRNVAGYSWQKIGQILDRLPNSCVCAYTLNKKRRKCGAWSNEEHQTLIQAVKTVMIESKCKNIKRKNTNNQNITLLNLNSNFSFNLKNLRGISWTKIASLVPTRNPHQCRVHFYRSVLKQV